MAAGAVMAAAETVVGEVIDFVRDEIFRGLILTESGDSSLLDGERKRDASVTLEKKLIDALRFGL